MTSTTTHVEAYDFAIHLSLPVRMAVGKPRCGHSSAVWIITESLFCALCFIRDGYHAELPGKLHQTKTLADNGNPQQTAKLQSHVRVVEGIFFPRKGQTLPSFHRARKRIGTKPSKNLYPFSSALWELAGFQPPLAEPLAKALAKTPQEVAWDMKLSLYNTYERLGKAVRWTTNQIMSYES